MLLGKLKRETDLIDLESVNTLSDDAKICKFKGIIITCLTIVKALIPNILWWVAVRIVIEASIQAIKEKCPDETQA